MRTELQSLCLEAVHKLQPNAYGVTVLEYCAEKMGREPSIGAIYLAMERLEADGKVTWSSGDPTPERGNRPKRFWTTT